jgi:hypothetical protein
MTMITGLVSTVLIFAIPIIAILTGHFQKQTKIRHEMMKDQLELEKLKHANFLMETEKMRLELQKEQLKYELPVTESVFNSKRD